MKPALFAMPLLLLAGCKAAHVDATVLNNTGEAVRLVEVDYPSASFGTEMLAAGASYHYRFKILGNGATKVTWMDIARKEHTVAGPDLREDQDGTLTVSLSSGTATWTANLKP